MSRRFLYACFWAVAAVGLIWLSIRFLLPIGLPFLLGLWLALAAEPMVRLLSGKLHFPRWAASALSVTLVFLLSATILALFFGFLMRQLPRLQDVLPQLEAAVSQGLALLRQWLRSIAQRLPGSFGSAIDRIMDDSPAAGGQFTQHALENLPQLLTKLAGRLSSGLFGLLTGIISGYMISGRLPGIKESLQKCLPGVWRERYLPAIKSMRKALGGWLLAQLKLAAVAFVLLLTGFWIIGIPNSLALSALITLVDAFPVLGVGTVLIPWSLICLLQENIAQGIGLLALYAVIWLIRSVLEPRLVGKGLGLDPLLTLISIYAGWQLLGIAGMLLAPIITMSVMQVRNTLRG